DDGRVLRSVALSQARLVVVEVDVEDPLEAIFDAPMVAHGLGGLLGGQRGGGDAISGFAARPVGEWRSIRCSCLRQPPGQAQAGSPWRRRTPDAAPACLARGRGCGARSCRRWL